MKPQVMWENESSRRGAGNTATALTHPSDLSGRRAGVSLPSSEQWRPIPGYEGRYEVSDFGRVRSTPRPSTRGGILKSQVRSDDGYEQVAVCRDGHRRMVRVHLLVMAAFRGPRPDGLEVRHLNGRSTDNRLANLVYGTHSENELDKRAHGTDHNVAKTHCPRRHRLIAPNLVRSVLARGHRNCLACHRARAAGAFARKRGYPFVFDLEADAQYARIMPNPEEADCA